MREEILQHRRAITAPVIFIIVIAFRFLSRWLEQLNRKGSVSPMDIQLRGEIRQLLKKASSLTQPSTFAQAAKLRRLAAAKEKELAKNQELQSKEKNLSYDLYLKVLFYSKVFIYFVLLCWFWKVPVAAISQQLVQPFGKFLSWRAGGPVNDNVMVGIIPWLVLSTRVSKIICRLFN